MCLNKKNVMKKVLLFLVIVVSLFSCKEEIKPLPTNISTALHSRNYYYDRSVEINKSIYLLTDSDINKLPKDSILSLISLQDVLRVDYSKYQNELDELLKYNPEYSSHPDMNMTYEHSHTDELEQVYDNISKLRNRYFSID